MLFTILIILLILALIGGFPAVGLMGSGVGYGPDGIVMVILVVVVIWMLMGRRGGGGPVL